jgi:hypothetical protein
MFRRGKGRPSDLVSSGKGRAPRTVVKEEGWAPGTCDVKFSLRLHIPISTRSFKLDRRETSATEVCVSSLDLVDLNLF